jgi:hypothetical protein
MSYDLLKSTKDIINILGGDKSKFTKEQKAFFDWVRQKLPNSNWQVWATKMFKKDPEGFKKAKDDLEHFGGSTHIKDIGDHRFDNKIHDTWEKGINELKEKENGYVEKITQNKRLIQPSRKTKEIVPINDEWGWFDLGVPYCKKEGEAMGHCGNAPSHVEGDRVLSLRRKVRIGKNVYHEPHLTFIENNGYLGEMKGKGNEKPNKKYHPHIVKLLEHPKIRSVVGGGYAHHRNFSLGDLDPTIKKALIKQKPELDFWQSKKAVKNAPEKFRNERDTVIWLNNLKNTNKNWKKELLRRIDDAPKMVLSALDINGKDKDIFDKLVDMAVNHNSEKEFSPLLSTHLGALVNDPEHIKKVLDSDNGDAKVGVVLGPHLKPESFEDIITKQKDPYVVSMLIKNRPEINAKHVDLAMKHSDDSVKAAALSTPHITDEHVDQAIRSGSLLLIEEALKTNKVKPRHLFYLLTHDNPRMQQLVPANKLTPELIEHAIMYSHPRTIENILDKVKLTPEQVDKVAEAHRVDHNILRKLLKTQTHTPKLVENAQQLVPANKLTPELIEHAIMYSHPHTLGNILDNVKLTPEQVDKAAEARRLDHDILGELLKKQTHTPKLVENAIKNGHPTLRRLIADSLYVPEKYLFEMLKSKNVDDVKAVFLNPKHNKKHVDMAVNSGDYESALAAAHSPHFNAQHAIQVLKNPQLKQLHSYMVRNFGHDENVLDFAVNSGEERLQSLAATNKNLKPEHIEKLINTGNEDVLVNIAKNPIHTKNHLESILDYGIKNDNFYVVSRAIKSPHFTEQHLNKLEQHGSFTFDQLIYSYKKQRGGVR